MNDTQFYPLTIKSAEPETDSAMCITFDVPASLKDTFKFTQGQFLTLKIMVNGEELRRAYSICSGIADNSLRVAIKRVEGGKLSNYVNDNIKAGDTHVIFTLFSLSKT